MVNLQQFTEGEWGAASLANHSNHHCLYKCINLLKRWEIDGSRVGIGTVGTTVNSHQFTAIHEERILSLMEYLTMIMFIDGFLHKNDGK